MTKRRAREIPQTNGEMLAYQAGKHFGEKSPGRLAWEPNDDDMWDSLVAGGVRCSEALSPERVTYWWQRGFHAGSLAETRRPEGA